MQLAIAEYERRIARLTAEPAADPSTVEEEIRDAFTDRRRRVDDDDQETHRQERIHEQVRQRPSLDAGAESEAKRLYRDLAKRFHPDLARTEDERSARERTMQRVNAAFQDRDLSALHSLSHEAEHTDPAFEARSTGDKFVWATREIARLDGLIESIDADLAAIRATDTHALWLRQQNGDSVIDLLAADIAEDLARERDHLAELITSYRHLIESRPQ